MRDDELSAYEEFLKFIKESIGGRSETEYISRDAPECMTDRNSNFVLYGGASACWVIWSNVLKKWLAIPVN